MPPLSFTAWTVVVLQCVSCERRFAKRKACTAPLDSSRHGLSFPALFGHLTPHTRVGVSEKPLLPFRVGVTHSQTHNSLVNVTFAIQPINGHSWSNTDARCRGVGNDKSDGAQCLQSSKKERESRMLPPRARSSRKLGTGSRLRAQGRWQRNVYKLDDCSRLGFDRST